VSDYAAFKDEEENAEINCSLLKGFVSLQNIVPAVCNMSEGVLPTVQALSEVVETGAGRGE